MIDPTPNLAGLWLALGIYGLGTATPGPSNMAIAATAATQGRRPALVLAAGVVSGSACWGLLAAAGLSSVLASYAQAMAWLKLIGGAYLLWLGWRAARQALHSGADMPTADASQSPSPPATGRLYLQGLAMHLTNPKVILSWLAIVTLALPAGAPASATLPVVAACVTLGLAVFGSYALVFSTGQARRWLAKAGRWLHGLLALVFGVAGIRLLLART